MKMFLVLVLTVAAMFVWQAHNEKSARPQDPVTEAQRSTPGKSRPISAHNWAKNSLDRAHQALDEVQQTREQNEDR